MSIYEGLMVMLGFGTFIIALLALILKMMNRK